MKPKPRGAHRRRRPARAPGTRENDASSFSPILLDFIARVPGAVGAVLVDVDGEAVDYAGKMDAFDLKLAGAHWQIILRDLHDVLLRRGAGSPLSLAVRGERRSFISHPLPDGYTLVLVLGRRAGFAPSTRAFAVCERALSEEAGWPRPKGATLWFSATVAENRSARPTRIAVGAMEQKLEIVGRVAGLAPRERGWRVRLQEGAELTLVREPGGFWYADEPVHCAASVPV